MHDTDTAPTYDIVRYFYGRPDLRRVVAFGLTLRQAQARCNDDASHGVVDGIEWFDAYVNEAS